MIKYIITETALDDYETSNTVEIMTLAKFHTYMKDAINKSMIPSSTHIMSKTLDEDDFTNEADVE